MTPGAGQPAMRLGLVALAPAFVVAVVLVAAAPTPSRAQPPPSVPDVRVLERGAEPRAPLRYAWPVGSTESSRLEMHIAATTSVKGRRLLELVIPATMSMTTRVVEVEADGTAHIDWVIHDLDFGEMAASIEGEPVAVEDLTAVVDGMGADAVTLTGFGGRVIVDAQGSILERTLDAGELVPSELVDELERSALRIEPLPPVPVGLGARWESTATHSSAGMDYAVVTTTEITGLDGNRIEVDQQLRSSPDGWGGAGRERAASPAALIDLDIAGTASSRIALDRLTRPGDASTRVHLRLAVDRGGGRSEVDYESVTDLVVSEAQ